MKAALEAAEREFVEHARFRAPVSEWPGGIGPVEQQAFSDAEIVQFQLLVHERARRRKEALRIYRPLPFQEAFHGSGAPERSIRGSNRSGKTLSSCVELARAVTGQDPHGKYPKSGRAVVVGKDEKHCGEVLYRKLFKPGAFRIIRDLETHEWRTYEPDRDEPRRKQRRLAPPLVPKRFYSEKDIGWSKKREEIPRKVVIRAGTDRQWEIYFFSSLGEAPQGWDVDFVLFDEEIEHPSWYPEMAARLIDRAEWDEEKQRWIGGKFVWSATPQAGTIKLYQIHQKAMDQIGEEQPQVTEHTATLFDNDYLPAKSKESFVKKMGENEDEARVRIYGEFALLGMRVYPEFSPRGVHGCDPFPVPHDWTRYVAIDPGRQICAVLFAAVPPPSHSMGDQVFLYDELYIPRCDAERFAELLAHKISHAPIQEALIDHHAGRITEMGSGKTVEEQYRQALVKRGVRFVASGGASFTWGSDDVPGRILAVRSGLGVRNGRSARWVVFKDRLPNFVKEAESYSYKKNTQYGLVTDTPLQINNHLMDCFDDKTDVLTDRGWRRFADVRNDDLLATVNLSTDMIEYQKPLAMIRKHYAGEMVQIKGSKLDAVVTPTHRMVVYSKGASSATIKLANDLSVWDRVKLNATWAGLDVDVLSGCDAGDLFEFLGWYVAEGSRSKRGSAWRVRIAQSKESGRVRLRELLGKLPWRWCECKDGFEASSRALHELLGSLSLGENYYEKRVPDIVRHASRGLIERFIDGAVFGDGWVQDGRRTVATTSKQLADGLQELFLKIGRAASVREVNRPGYLIRGRSSECRGQFWVSEWTCSTGSLRNSRNSPNFSRVKYDGEVFCATVPNGTLVVRRNGKPMIAGNCWGYLAAHGLPYRRQRSTVKSQVNYAFNHVKRKREQKAAKFGGGRGIKVG